MTESPERPLATRVYSVSDPRALIEAVDALRRGQVAAFPTDTVYGVGCDLWQAEAIARLYWVKQRPSHLAIPVLVSSAEHVGQVAQNVPAAFGPLVERLWPGGLTVVVPRRPGVPDILCAGGPTVAVRMPDHAWTLALIEALGGALAATSANLSSRPSPCTAQEVLADLDGRVAVIIDGGECHGGVASSIVDLTSEPPVLLRSGGLEVDAIRSILPGLTVHKSL